MLFSEKSHKLQHTNPKNTKNPKKCPVSQNLKIFKNHKNCQNSEFFLSIIFSSSKIQKCLRVYFFVRKNSILLVFPIEEINLWPEISSPARFRTQGGGPLSVTAEHARQSLCLILDAIWQLQAKDLTWHVGFDHIYREVGSKTKYICHFSFFHFSEKTVTCQNWSPSQNSRNDIFLKQSAFWHEIL